MRIPMVVREDDTKEKAAVFAQLHRLMEQDAQAIAHEHDAAVRKVLDDYFDGSIPPKIQEMELVRLRRVDSPVQSILAALKPNGAVKSMRRLRTFYPNDYLILPGRQLHRPAENQIYFCEIVPVSSPFLLKGIPFDILRVSRGALADERHLRKFFWENRDLRAR